LIKPLTVRGDEARPVIPIASVAPTLHYQKNYTSPALAIWRAPMLLFTLGSGAVLLIMFAMQLFALFFWILIGGGLIFAVFFPGVIYMLTIAHIANVVEETGPEEKDELPTPMRGASWYEDIWLPYLRFTVAFAICYWPAFLVFFSRTMLLKFGPLATLGISGGLAILASFFFPVVLLIATAGGTYVNLRPDRVIGTIGAIGFRYFLVFLLWIAAAWTFTAGTIGSIVYAYSLVAFFQPNFRPMSIGLSIALLAFGLYLLHMFAWILGGFYRSYHDRFPWAFQRHISTRKIERRKVRKGKPIPLQAKDPGILAPEPPPRLRPKPAQE
jgi:hypothetical protein